MFSLFIYCILHDVHKNPIFIRIIVPILNVQIMNEDRSF